MKLLLTPQGPSDRVIDCVHWCDSWQNVIPCNKEVVNVVLCTDGKDQVRAGDFAVDMNLYKHYFVKLCRGPNKTRCQHQVVEVKRISFWDTNECFFDKLRDADIFYMAGFQIGHKRIEQLFHEHERFEFRRTAVANRCCQNLMTFWGVCGSAVACGSRWDYISSSNRLWNFDVQFFRMLGHDGVVGYNANDSPGVLRPKILESPLNVWHIGSGFGLCICIKADIISAKAFRCVGKNNDYKQAWSDLVDLQSERLARQAEMLASVSTDYNALKDGICYWRFYWGTGGHEWIEPMDVQVHGV